MNVSFIEITLQAICITILFFIFSGYICYKTRKADTWEEGVKKVFNTIYDFLYEGATGKSPLSLDSIVDPRLCLSSEELLGLTKRLESVYEQLQLANGIVYSEGIAWFDYSAFRIEKNYKDLSLDDRKRLLSSIIRKYYQEIHGTLDIPLYIKICSEYRFHFAIGLTLAGIKYLDKQEAFTTCNEQDFRTEYSSKIIEEPVPEDTDNDIRL